MGYDGINKCTPPRKSGEIPSVSTRFILGAENEQADGIAEIVSRDKILRRERGQYIFPLQLTTRRIGNLTRLIHTLQYAVTMHTPKHRQNRTMNLNITH